MKAADLLPAGDLNEAYQVDTNRDPQVLQIDDHDPIVDFTKLHALAAYMYAHGNPISVIGTLTGHSQKYIAQWVQGSRSFNQVVADFQADPDLKPQYNPVATANTILGEALDELLRRLANEPDSFTNKEIIYLVQMLSDRTDLGLNPKAPAKDEAPVDVRQIKEMTDVEARKTAQLPALEEALGRARDTRGLDQPQGRVEVLLPEEE